MVSYEHNQWVKRGEGERGRKSGRERVKWGTESISGQLLLIATYHTSPQLSQIAIEK